jgi:hypothetical protein
VSDAEHEQITKALREGPYTLDDYYVQMKIFKQKKKTADFRDVYIRMLEALPKEERQGPMSRWTEAATKATARRDWAARAGCSVEDIKMLMFDYTVCETQAHVMRTLTSLGIELPEDDVKFEEVLSEWTGRLGGSKKVMRDFRRSRRQQQMDSLRRDNVEALRALARSREAKAKESQ